LTVVLCALFVHVTNKLPLVLCLFVITTASKQISVLTNLLPSAITTIREKQFYSTNSTTTTTLKHTVDYTALLHRVFLLLFSRSFHHPSTLLFFSHIYTRFSCTMTYFHCYLNITSIPEIESFHYTLWQYLLPIIFSREQIIGQLPSTFSFRRYVCQESIAKHSCKQVIYSILNCY
ncbi:hypothetical protein T12_9369, partial [Trichinella patagoniensis]